MRAVTSQLTAPRPPGPQPPILTTALRICGTNRREEVCLYGCVPVNNKKTKRWRGRVEAALPARLPARLPACLPVCPTARPPAGSRLPPHRSGGRHPQPLPGPSTSCHLLWECRSRRPGPARCTSCCSLDSLAGGAWSGSCTVTSQCPGALGPWERGFAGQVLRIPSYLEVLESLDARV